MPESPQQPIGTPVHVSVVRSSAPRTVEVFEVRLSAGASVADALAGCGLTQASALIGARQLGVAVWGRRAALSQPLRDGDRIELCRPLLVDPKTARRERFARQGRRASGLFAAPAERGV